MRIKYLNIESFITINCSCPFENQFIKTPGLNKDNMTILQ